MLARYYSAMLAAITGTTEPRDVAPPSTKPRPLGRTRRASVPEALRILRVNPALLRQLLARHR